MCPCGDDDLLELEAEFGEPAANAADLVAGIDHDGLARLFVAQDGAVAGKRADRKGFEDHGSIVGRKAVNNGICKVKWFGCCELERKGLGKKCLRSCDWDELIFRLGGP